MHNLSLVEGLRVLSHRGVILWMSVVCSFLMLVIPSNGQQWQLEWWDEFDYTGAPDPTKWGYDVGGGGWGNNELQYYTDGRLENARVENGNLIIEAIKESFGGREYTSARLVTRDKAEWTYGRIEVSAKLPTGRGTWPAIWLLYADNPFGNGSWPDNGEIDIMEHVGFDQDRVHSTIHVNKYNSPLGTQRGSSKTVAGASTSFHTYELEWTPARLNFRIDGVLFFSYLNENEGWTSWPFDMDFYLILNIAIGGDWGGLEGIDDSIFPQKMEVDYVRVYSYTGLPEVSLVSPADSLSLESGASLDLAALASDADGSIDELVIFQGDGVLATSSTDSVSTSITDVEPGCYSISAKATDDLGWSSQTAAIPVTVGDECTQAPYLMTSALIPGTIEAEYFDLGGQNQGYFDLDPVNTGTGIRQSEGVDIERVSDVGGGYYVGWIANREWLEYSVNVEEAGTYMLDVRVASETNGGTVSVSFDGVDKTGSISFPGTGGDQTWETVSSGEFELDAGKQKMRISFVGSAFNVNWIRLTKTTNSSVEPESSSHQFELSQNYPNPFTGRSSLEFTLRRPGHVHIDLYDRTGKLVRTLVNGPTTAGSHRVQIDASGLAAGVYFYRMSAAGSVITRSTTVLK